jgi:hypothetical protein
VPVFQPDYSIKEDDENSEDGEWTSSFFLFAFLFLLLSLEHYSSVVSGVIVSNTPVLSPRLYQY